MAASSPLAFCQSAAVAHVHERIKSGAIPPGDIVAAGDSVISGDVATVIADFETKVADFKRQHSQPHAATSAQKPAASSGPWAQRFAAIAHAVDRFLPSTEVRERVVVRVKHASGEATYAVDVTDPFATNVARTAAQTALFAGTTPCVGPGLILAGAAMCWKRARNELDTNTRIGLKRAATRLGVLSALRMVPVTEPVCLLLGAAELSAKRDLQQRASYTTDGSNHP